MFVKEELTEEDIDVILEVHKPTLTFVYDDVRKFVGKLSWTAMGSSDQAQKEVLHDTLAMKRKGRPEGQAESVHQSQEPSQHRSGLPGKARGVQDAYQSHECIKWSISLAVVAITPIQATDQLIGGGGGSRRTLKKTFRRYIRYSKVEPPLGQGPGSSANFKLKLTTRYQPEDDFAKSRRSPSKVKRWRRVLTWSTIPPTEAPKAPKFERPVSQIDLGTGRVLVSFRLLDSELPANCPKGSNSTGETFKSSLTGCLPARVLACTGEECRVLVLAEVLRRVGRFRDEGVGGTWVAGNVSGRFLRVGSMLKLCTGVNGAEEVELGMDEQVDRSTSALATCLYRIELNSSLRIHGSMRSTPPDDSAVHERFDDSKPLANLTLPPPSKNR
ncbi:hypothetical protein C8F01DRAFT_1226663 [Mycena amicta]|nr:hypothetical protein C8F01DRAFT_1226663 [Mycena amicta]